MLNNNSKIAVAALGATMLFSAGANASGFNLREQSIGAQGSATAGVAAGSSDISYMYFNPASLTMVQENQAQLDVSYLVGQTKAKNAKGAVAGGAVPIANGAKEESNILESAAIPAAYFAGKLSDNWYAGLSINIPFGFKTEYDRNWVGRYHAIKSDIRTANINSQLATNITDKFSVGAGFQVEYVDAELSQAVDFGSIGAALAAKGAPIVGALPTQQDGYAKVAGDDWGFGYSIGGIYKVKENLRVGLSYRSRVEHKIEGTTEFERSAMGNTIAGVTGAFVSSDAFVNFTSPSQVYLGVRWDVNDKWALLGEADRINWSSFDVLKVQYSNDNQSASITEEKWSDVYFFALGTEYKWDDETTLKAGVAFDESPVHEAYRTPRIPGSNRVWLTFGMDYKYSNAIDFSAGYTHIFVCKNKLDLSHNDAGSSLKGDLQVDYEGAMDIFGFSANIKF